MHGTRTSTRKLAEAVAAGLAELGDVDVAICPSFVHIPELSSLVAGTRLQLGAQSVADQDEGAFTGEVSGSMLREFSCSLVLVGHSERRHVYGETDELVAQRFAAALRHDLMPILCVGETLEQHEAGDAKAVVRQQLEAVFANVGDGAFQRAAIAYEPVWAIGTGRTATPQQAQEIHAYIRTLVAERDSGAADSVRILYGGSMKPDNAAALFAEPDINGGLIGGASLKAEEFLAICRAAV